MLDFLDGTYEDEHIVEYGALYKRTETGATQVWRLERLGSKYRTLSGQFQGKLVTSEWKQCKGKNIGKKNERTPEEQAKSEIESTYKSRLEKDYYTDINDIDKGCRYFEPMLAEDFKDAINKKCAPVLTDCFSQRKYNGMRCILDKNGLKSREGKEIVSCPHLSKILEPLFNKNPDLIFDGELYNHEFHDDFNELMSIFKQGKPTWDDIEKSEKYGQYYIYDLPSNNNIFSVRNKELNELIKSVADWHIVAVPTDKIESKEHLDELYMQYLADGFEGQIIREDKVYENKRTWSLLKRKEFIDAEFELVDILEGLGNWAGKAKSAALVTADGIPFNAGITGKMKFCEDLLKNKEKYIGKMTTVNYFSITPEGKPLFGRCKEFDRAIL